MYTVINIVIHSIIVLLITTECKSTQEMDWIDPHEMTLKNSDVLQRPPGKLQEQIECTPTHSVSLSHYKRLISFLLNLVHVDDSSDYSGHLNLRISKVDFQYLRQFARDSDYNENAAVLRKIDQIMIKILTKSKMDYIADAIITWTDYIYYHFYNRATAIIASCIFLLFISYKLLKASFTIWSVIKYLLFLAWVADFAFTWINLLKEAEINQMADSLRYQAVPPYCDPNKMSWLQYLWYTISTDSECRNYHQAIYKDVFWSVAPFQVISYQLGIVVYTPASHTGKAVGSFVSGLLASLPMGVNIILLPLLLVFSVLILCILLSFLTDTSFGFNILYLLQFHFGSKERKTIENVLSGSNLAAVLNLAQRKMIEDVSPSNMNEPKKVENCSCRDNSDEKSVENKHECVMPEIKDVITKEEGENIENAQKGE